MLPYCCWTLRHFNEIFITLGPSGVAHVSKDLVLNLADTITLQPSGGFTPIQVYCPSALQAGVVSLYRSGWVAARFCGTHISETAGQIFSIWSFTKFSGPEVVRCHCHFPIWPIWACPESKNLLGLSWTEDVQCWGHLPIRGSMWGKKLDHYLKQWWPSLVTHICIIWPLWVNPLRLSDAYMCQ